MTGLLPALSPVITDFSLQRQQLLTVVGMCPDVPFKSDQILTVLLPFMCTTRKTLAVLLHKCHYPFSSKVVGVL